MSIRIRVYPQPGSHGWRRNRARRLHQQQLRQSVAWQQQLFRQQSMQQMYGGYGYASPYAASWGSVSQFPSFGSLGSAWSGAYALPGYGGVGSYSSYSGGYSPVGYSPVGYAQAAGYGRAWGC